MAMFDTRVFRSNSEWWAAQVHGGSGVGVGHGRPPIQDETVVFTCLTDDQSNSQLGSIVAGTLKLLSHGAIKKVLARSRPWSIRLDIGPSNVPDPEELAHDPSFEDDEGLRWVVRRTKASRMTRGGVIDHPAVEVICLDDSALRKQILLENDATYEDALAWASFDITAALVSLVKGEHDIEAPAEDEL